MRLVSKPCDIYSVKYLATSQKKTNKETNKWKDILCSQIGRLNIVKMAKHPNLIYRFSAFLSKSQLSSLQRLILKFT